MLNPNTFCDYKINPHYLDDKPCSYVAILCAAHDFHYGVFFNNFPKVDKTGYCKLHDMTTSLKTIFELNKIRYNYVAPAFRVTLEEFMSKHQGEKFVICVRGHFVYFNGSDYCSFFDNLKDEVIAVWRIS